MWTFPVVKDLPHLCEGAVYRHGKGNWRAGFKSRYSLLTSHFCTNPLGKSVNWSFLFPIYGLNSKVDWVLWFKIRKTLKSKQQRKQRETTLYFPKIHSNSQIIKKRFLWKALITHDLKKHVIFFLNNHTMMVSKLISQTTVRSPLRTLTMVILRQINLKYLRKWLQCNG